MLRSKIKFFICMALIIITTFILSGCWDRTELEEQAFVVLMGIDKAKDKGNVKVTIAIAIPSQIAGGGAGGGGGGKQEENVSVVSMEVPAISSGLNTMNTFVSRKINLQHMKILVLGEELAKEGVQETLGSIVRNREIRRSMTIAVGRPTAADFIKNLKPKLGTSPSKYLEDTLVMLDSTGAIPKAFYHTFLTNYESYGDEPYTMVVSARNKVAKEQDIPKKRAEEKTDIPGKGDPFRESGIDVDLPGTAVFKGEKLVGELNGDETRIFNMIRGDFRRAIMTFRDPFEKDKAFVVDLRQGSPPKVTAKFEGDKPMINLRLSLEGDLMGYQTAQNYAEDEEKRAALERMVAGNINERIKNLIKKSQDQYNTDIFGFGNRAIRQKFLTWQEWTDYHWLGKFREAKVKVVVKFAIRRIGLNFGPPVPKE